MDQVAKLLALKHNDIAALSVFYQCRSISSHLTATVGLFSASGFVFSLGNDRPISFCSESRTNDALFCC